ncbi:MAG: hypothetical protein H8D97_01450 [Proteobacteria bacterium]|nr:hypothetical protein [Pseudomonadota bacterium]
MAENIAKPESAFEIDVSIPIVGFINRNDVNEFRAIRVPIKKYGSFAAIVLPMPQIIYLHLEDLGEQSNFPEMTIAIDMVDPKSPIPNTRSHKKTKHIATKQYRILACDKIDSDDQPRNQIQVVRLIIVSPVLFAMNGTSGFNIISSSETAMEVIKNFEEYLLEQYGDTAFEFHKVGEEENLNEHTYEQLMVRQETDVSVCKFLLNEKKALNSYTYYFFDNFRVTPETTGDTCGLLINLTNKDLFTPIDVFSDKYKDIQGLKLIKKQPLYNPFSSVQQGPQRQVIKDMSSSHLRGDDPSPIPFPQIKTTTTEISISSDRKQKAPIGELSKKDKPITGIKNIYTPDSAEQATIRLEAIEKQQSDTLRSKQFYEVKECYPETFQFDRIYNMDEHERASYQHVPVSIINIFRKENNNETLMKHGVQLQVFKLAPS